VGLLGDEVRLSGSGKAEDGAEQVVVPASPIPASSTLADFSLGKAAYHSAAGRLKHCCYAQAYRTVLELASSAANRARTSKAPWMGKFGIANVSAARLLNRAGSVMVSAVLPQAVWRVRTWSRSE
jgi:hypothetical protein